VAQNAPQVGGAAAQPPPPPTGSSPVVKPHSPARTGEGACGSVGAVAPPPSGSTAVASLPVNREGEEACGATAHPSPSRFAGPSLSLKGRGIRGRIAVPVFRLRSRGARARAPPEEIFSKIGVRTMGNVRPYSCVFVTTWMPFSISRPHGTLFGEERRNG
jgi:hypothetical protein